MLECETLLPIGGAELKCRILFLISGNHNTMQTLPIYSSLRSLTALLMLALMLTGCGINNIPTYDEKVKAAWSQVENQYQRRADLIPNLVETVKGFATQEKETLTAVVEARSRATSIQDRKSTRLNSSHVRIS